MDRVESAKEQTTYYNWSLLLQFLLLFTVIGLLFQESTEPLFARWVKWDQDLSHGIPTLFAFLFLILRSQHLPYFKNSRAVSSVLITGIAILSLAWLLFIIANITILANVTLLLSIPLIIAASYSITSARFLLPIIGMLIFTIPFFGQLNNILVVLSAKAVGILVNLFGMTALLDGQNIFIPSGHIYIADGCSGLRYFTISILLGYLLSILNHYSLKGTIYTLVIATGLGLITNWVRIFLLVVIGDITEMKSSLMHDHEFFGWILFACVMFPAIFFAPIKASKNLQLEAIAKPKPWAPLVALTLGPVLLFLIPNKQQTIQEFTLATLNGPVIQQPGSSPLNLQIPNGIRNEDAQVYLAGINIYVHLSEYRPNSLKEKIIPYLEELYDKEEWRITQRQVSPELKALGFQSLILTRAYKQEYAVLLYRFEIGPYNANNYQTAKILQIPATFAGKRYSNIFSTHSICKNEACVDELKTTTELALQWDKATKPIR